MASVHLPTLPLSAACLTVCPLCPSGPNVNPALVQQQPAKEEAVSSSKDPSPRNSVLTPENRVSENIYDNLSFEPGAETCCAQEQPGAVKEPGSGAGSPA